MNMQILPIYHLFDDNDSHVLPIKSANISMFRTKIVLN